MEGRKTSPSAHRNKEFIYEILNKYLLKSGKLLEIGSGTGEHGIFFAERFKKIKWTTSDIKANHSSIKDYIKDSRLTNIFGPEKLRVGVDDFPLGKFDYVFTANTLHIMSWKENKTLFKLLGKRLREGAQVFFYGPFNYNENFTSQSNANFDLWLKDRNPNSGIRNFEAVFESMKKAGFSLIEDHEMPANNRILVFERLKFKPY